MAVSGVYLLRQLQQAHELSDVLTAEAEVPHELVVRKGRDVEASRGWPIRWPVLYL